MKDLNIAVCDDEDFYVEQMENLLSKYSSDNQIDLNTSGFCSGIDLLDDMKDDQEKYEIIFMDVDMPKLSGIETARRIREYNNRVNLCFITGYDNYALNAYQVDALGYIVKPIAYQQLCKVMDHAVVLISHEQEKNVSEKKYLNLNINKENIMIDTSSILYIEKNRNQIIFNMEDRMIVCYETLKNIYQKLEEDSFIYTHQGFIVNFNKIKEVRRTEVCLGNNIRVPISRGYYNIVRNKHMSKINRLGEAKYRKGDI